MHAGKISYYVEAGRGRPFEREGHGEVIRGLNRSAHTREIADWVGHALPGHRHRRINGLPPDVAIRAGYHRAVASSQPSDAAPVDPPIPVPDVPGADATARGLPRRVDLTLRQRLIVDSSAIADLGLRTAIASLVSAAMLPQVAVAAMRPVGAAAQRDALRFYAELGAAKDPNAVVPRTDGGAADLVAPGQSGRGMDGQRPRAQHPVQQQLRGGQPGDARPVRRRMCATTSCMRSTGVTTTDPTRRCA